MLWICNMENISIGRRYNSTNNVFKDTYSITLKEVNGLIEYKVYDSKDKSNEELDGAFVYDEFGYRPQIDGKTSVLYSYTRHTIFLHYVKCSSCYRKETSKTTHVDRTSGQE